MSKCMEFDGPPYGYFDIPAVTRTVGGDEMMRITYETFEYKVPADASVEALRACSERFIEKLRERSHTIYWRLHPKFKQVPEYTSVRFRLACLPPMTDTEKDTMLDWIKPEGGIREISQDHRCYATA